MKRIEPEHKKNDLPPVPILSGKAKHGKIKARPMVADGSKQPCRVYHGTPHAFPDSDNDLAAENLANDFDLTAADLQDL